MTQNVTNPKQFGSKKWVRGANPYYRIAVAIDREFEEILKQAARDELRSVADLVRIACRDWLVAHGYIVMRKQRAFDDGRR